MEKAAIQIWLAEDNEGDVYLMRQALDEQAFLYNLRVFQNGEQALQLVDTAGTDNDRACPDLLILDLHLPKVDGQEVLRRFRANADCVNTPVLIMSSMIAPPEREFIDRFSRTTIQEKPLNLDGYLNIGQQVKSILMLYGSVQ